MQIRLYNPSYKEAWDSFVMNTDGGTCSHLSAWREVFENTYGYRTYYLYATKSPNADGSDNSEPDIAGILPLALIKSRLFGRFLISLPFFDQVGVLACSKDAQKALLEKAVEIAKKQKVEFIEFRHLSPTFPDALNGECFGGELITKQHKVTLLLDLPNTSDELWKSFKSKLRSQIRKPIKEGLTARIGGIEELDDFYKVFSQNMRDLGTPVNSKILFRNILLGFPGQARIFIVSKDSYPVGAGFVIGFKKSLHIPWASALKKFNHLAPNMLLYWSILEYACNQGYEIFDFGRTTTGAGTNKFKEQWNPRPIPLHWQYWIANGGEKPELNKENPKFQMFIKIWQNLPLPIANIIGPRIVRYLPQ
jgi:serine/alanine adding enzyme